ncbi:monofunctional biosynthetic peptidoglycan transglycosylase [Solemya velum gill symbiont]|uniref:Biosynthetic peptidoglycan transglycosylase n=1 Tax=Solemya velum gill symbiont TaxID=2340 RepID=A0A0B0HE41_SOVGS|nr:monofunctional biosynthetic peptidoglycan transglycosylase [Solemya velum gill symbiont]KHF25726.1 monofunctional biosynthetic peptidoglycan transglycosylase [Solemya velum gill symbiont]OOY35676.1 monofunctional biosynthetic peptidoglycan transglycosylase [Solemya velum gill symbiont]OOY38304.1 monofunctional biosynthetic peptidoglycan transglycosylase [Solemya velum gill symbiont]OOY40779.1 monofunctional biosynthetic peptidoglycan transglycosylase [Solemya velum gill symbiont]OOY42916.1 
MSRQSSRKSRLKKWLFLSVLLPILLLLILVLVFRWVPVPTTSFMLQASWNAWQQPNQHEPVRHDWVKYSEISPQLALAVIASEDQRFPEHYGFDTVEIMKVLESNTASRGASTLTQQLAKNLFLWSGRSYVRKVIEAGITLLIELMWSKERILEVYLNSVQFGNGIYGAESASQIYFRSSARYLSDRQAALLAAVLPNPRAYSADRPDAYVVERQKRILRQMRNLGGVGYLERIK